MRFQQRPRVNIVSIASPKYLSKMIDEYAIDPNFKHVMFAIEISIGTIE